MTNPVPPIIPAPVQLEQLRKFSTSIVASAIELCDVRLPNTGFANSLIRCIFDDLPPVAGHAATVRIRTSAPPMEGGRYSYARTDWCNHLLNVPAPRILVMQDLDATPGVGAFVGEVHACLLQALGCTALVTNGAVRDVREIKLAGFQMFAGNVAVSHAYAHVFDFGGPVEIAGLKIKPGDLIHGDVNGVLSVPANILDRILTTADELIRKRRSLTNLCCSTDFSLAKLHDMVQAGEQTKHSSK